MSAGLIPQLHPLVRSVIQEVETEQSDLLSYLLMILDLSETPPPVSQI
jgi:hypothetical protein